jgi:hypothetical protein
MTRTDRAEVFAPPIPGRTFHPEAMEDIGQWVLNEADHVIFVYGQNDPWSAGQFAISEGHDVHKYVVAAGDHGSQLRSRGMPAASRDEAYEILRTWTGVSAPLSAANAYELDEPLDDSLVTRRRL